MRRACGIAGALFVLSAGCSVPQREAAQPALLIADAGNAAILHAAIEQALHVPVLLAANALTQQATLIVEAQPARVDGQRIDGRETRRLEHFTLQRQSDGACVLRREGSGELLALRGVRCGKA